MQDVLAILIAAVAAVYLARRVWLRIVYGKRGTCGTCPGCGPTDSVKQVPLVTIDQVTSSATSGDKTVHHRGHDGE